MYTLDMYSKTYKGIDKDIWNPGKLFAPEAV